jgi:hypothetical protein
MTGTKQQAGTLLPRSWPRHAEPGLLRLVVGFLGGRRHQPIVQLHRAA